jgi:esterase/lipase
LPKIISRLELQLKAQAARASLLHSRLAATQNALDVERVKHAEDLMAEQVAKNKLQQKLFTYHQHVKNVEQEKDELRDAVAEFLQKG